MNTTTNASTLDVFQAAAWLDEVWNSTAHAISADLIKWQCTTWGSGAVAQTGQTPPSLTWSLPRSN